MSANETLDAFIAITPKAKMRLDILVHKNSLYTRR